MNFEFNTKEFIPVNQIDFETINYQRIVTKVKAVDEMTGGGFAPGTVFTLSGAPGTGKTTFLLQVCQALGEQGYTVGYASGEESVTQLANTCNRIDAKNIYISNETDIDMLVKYTEQFNFLIIDSFAAVTSSVVRQKQHEKYCIDELCKAAKKTNCIVGIVLQVLKSGRYKGSTLIPHSVDLNFEIRIDDEKLQPAAQTIIFKTTKNRFGPCAERTSAIMGCGHRWDCDWENYGPFKHRK